MFFVQTQNVRLTHDSGYYSICGREYTVCSFDIHLSTEFQFQDETIVCSNPICTLINIATAINFTKARRVRRLWERYASSVTRYIGNRHFNVISLIIFSIYDSVYMHCIQHHLFTLIHSTLLLSLFQLFFSICYLFSAKNHVCMWFSKRSAFSILSFYSLENIQWYLFSKSLILVPSVCICTAAIVITKFIY